jgi:hypothetical protein
VNYSWDKNGNLLSDGVNTYTYNAANQLTGFDGQSIHASFAYDGLGDRLQQTIGGVPTNYPVDINNALPQVLQGGTDSYIYGVGNLSQINGSTNEGEHCFIEPKQPLDDCKQPFSECKEGLVESKQPPSECKQRFIESKQASSEYKQGLVVPKQTFSECKETLNEFKEPMLWCKEASVECKGSLGDCKG